MFQNHHNHMVVVVLKCGDVHDTDMLFKHAFSKSHTPCSFKMHDIHQSYNKRYALQRLWPDWYNILNKQIHLKDSIV